jgi:acyl-CoA:acyl-CoA alkyltransferase
MDHKSKCMSAFITAVEVFLPDQVVDNTDIEQRVRAYFPAFAIGTLAKILGSQTRRFAPTHMQVSDLACAAAEKILSKTSQKIDLLLFAAASSDLIEPATAAIIQDKLGLMCPALDIKNACNSVTTAIQVATAFIESGVHKNVLIVNGEKLSEVINYKPTDADHLMRCIPAYALGDAGTALLISHQGSEGRILYQKSQTWGQFWPLCMVEGGGSLAYWDHSKYYFEGQGRALQDAFQEYAVPFVRACIAESGTDIQEIDLVFSHQVSKFTPQLIADATGINSQKIVRIFGEYGNIAAASIPVAIHHARTNLLLKPGHRVLIIGLAAGISVSVQIVQF